MRATSEAYNMEKEIWKDIPKYEGYYKASNFGRIKSVDRIIYDSKGRKQKFSGRVLRQTTTTKGYKRVQLNKGGTGKHVFVHVVVLTSFYPRPDSLTQVNHKDEDKANNRLENLEYCTASYNQNYGHCSANKSRATRNDKKKSKPIIQMTTSGTVINEFPSIREAERVLGFQHGHLREACNGNLHTAYGYKWKWASQKKL